MSFLTARPSARRAHSISDSPSPASVRPTQISRNRLLPLIALAILCSLTVDHSIAARVQMGAGGSCRSRNFVVSAPSGTYARQVCQEAERFRKELAIEWTGQELPPWQHRCPIRVKVGRHLGAGGATSFTFINGQPRKWQMEIQGSRQRILDSVLPHEITHTIFATHFGRPLPRWADEGAATSVEHTSERRKQEKLLVQFLTTNRGIAFNRMFAMREYPQDILPLYSQGYSLARYLIAQGGKRKFIAYVGDGMRWNNWTRATKEHYGMESLSELQLTWLDWVRRGSPAIQPQTQENAIALAEHTESARGNPAAEKQPVTTVHASGLVPLPGPGKGRSASRENGSDPDPPQRVAAGSPRDGWYSRRRNEAMNHGSDVSKSSPRPQRSSIQTATASKPAVSRSRR